MGVVIGVVGVVGVVVGDVGVGDGVVVGGLVNKTPAAIAMITTTATNMAIVRVVTPFIQTHPHKFLISSVDYINVSLTLVSRNRNRYVIHLLNR